MPPPSQATELEAKLEKNRGRRHNLTNKLLSVQEVLLAVEAGTMNSDDAIASLQATLS